MSKVKVLIEPKIIKRPPEMSNEKNEKASSHLPKSEVEQRKDNNDCSVESFDIVDSLKSNVAERESDVNKDCKE